MSKHMRDLLKEALHQIVDINYGQPSISDPTQEKFNEGTRRACNLIGDVFTAEQAQRRRDEVVTAKEIFVEAHKSRPDRWDGCSHLSRVSLLLGEFDEAAKWNERAFDRIQANGGEGLDKATLNVRYAQYHELRAEIALAKGDPQAATQEFLRALAIDPSVHNRLSLVRVYSIIGDIKSAVVQIEALERHPDFALWAGEFLARVLEEGDFAPLRASRAWRGTVESPGIQGRWGATTKRTSAHLRQTFVTDRGWKRRLKRVLLYVTVLIIVVGLKVWLPNVTFGMSWSGKVLSPAREWSVPRKIIDKAFADLRPWGQGAGKIRRFVPVGSNPPRATTFAPAFTQHAYGLRVFYSSAKPSRRLPHVQPVSSAYIVSTKHSPVIPWQDELVTRILVGGDLLVGGSLAKKITHPVNRGAAAPTVVRAVPVVEMPLGEPVFQLRIPQKDSGLELFGTGSLRPFNLPVEKACTRPGRREFDALLAKSVSHRIGKELLALVCPDTLNGKRYFLDH
ncbi:MAG: hypothetical protein OXU75_17605 [Deltaproteobacteria bacterium]|nr:hypothetical protein [Deltaproteobacteria bacterium]